METDIPPDVLKFVLKHIDTLEQLEVLLLVSALPDREWTGDDVYQVVKTNPNLVKKRLEEFTAKGFLVRAGEGYRYAPQNDEIARQIANVASFYKLGRHRLIELIYSPTTEEMRGFSEAFRFRKRE